jgi:hypothetical protein
VVDFVSDLTLKSGTKYPTQSVSVIWSGYVQPKFSEAFRFKLDANHRYSLLLDEALIIDSDPQLSAPVALAAGQLYRVEVRYAKTNGTPKVRLMWQSNSQELQVIPAESLFNLQYIDAVPHSFNVSPAESDPSRTLFEQTSGLEEAVVNVEEVHILTVRDEFGNLKQD